MSIMTSISKVLANKVSEVSTYVANTSTKQTPIGFWQEPKMPKVLLKKIAK